MVKKASPRKSSPKRASPKRASPKRASPKRASPKRGSPKRASPKRGSPKREGKGSIKVQVLPEKLTAKELKAYKEEAMHVFMHMDEESKNNYPRHIAHEHLRYMVEFHPEASHEEKYHVIKDEILKELPGFLHHYKYHLQHVLDYEDPAYHGAAEFILVKLK